MIPPPWRMKTRSSPRTSPRSSSLPLRTRQSKSLCPTSFLAAQSLLFLLKLTMQLLFFSSWDKGKRLKKGDGLFPPMPADDVLFTSSLCGASCWMLVPRHRRQQSGTIDDVTVFFCGISYIFSLSFKLPNHSRWTLEHLLT